MHLPSSKIEAIRFSLIYLIVGVLWIVLTDLLLIYFIKEPTKLIFLKSIMDGIFMLVSASLLYRLIRHFIQLLGEEKYRLEASIQQMPIGISIAEAPSGKLLLSNQRTEEILQVPLQPATKLEEYSHYYKGFHLDGKPYQSKDWPLARSILFGECINHEEIIVARQDGSRCMIQVNSAPIYDSNKKMIAGIASFFDISAQKETERQIQKSLQNYQSLVDTVDGIVWESDSNFRFIFVSKQAERLLGYPAEEWLSEPSFWADHIHPDDRNWATRFCQEQSMKMLPHEFEYRIIAADGRVVWLRDIVSVMVKENQFAGLRGIMVDITAHKHAMDELGSSLSLLHTTLESTADGILVVNLDEKFVKYNQKFVELWNISFEILDMRDNARVIQLILGQIKNPDPFLSKMKELYAHPEVTRNDIIELKDGRTFERYSQPHWMDGKIVGRVWSFRDITDRVQAISRLIESEARKSAVFESALDCIISMDHEGKVREFNPAAEVTFGYKAADIIGKEMAEFIIPPFLRDRHRQGLARFLLTGEGPMIDKRIQLTAMRSDGTEFPAEISISRVRKTGPPIFTGFIRDITERKQAEEMLRRSESRLKAIVQNEPECVKILDSEGTLLEMNPAGLAMIEVEDPVKAIGKCIYSSISAPYLHQFRELTERVCRGENGKLEYEIVGRRGTKLWLETHAAPLFDERTGKNLLLAVTRNITEQKKAEAERETLLVQERRARMEAEKSVQLRDDFLSIASHELRTPLTPIRMHLQLVRRHLQMFASHVPNSDLLIGGLESADQQFDRFLKLVENLLDVSRITANRLTLEREVWDLSELVREVVGRFQSEFEKQGCTVSLNLEPQIQGFWDRLRIEQVVINLLTNAMKFGAGKPVEISLSLKRNQREESKAKLTVRDHGIGIAKEDQTKLFGRFERVAPLKYYGGLGLGLYISRNIVSAHGGTIYVESDVGKGAAFTVELPLSEGKMREAV